MKYRRPNRWLNAWLLPALLLMASSFALLPDAKGQTPPGDLPTVEISALSATYDSRRLTSPILFHVTVPPGQDWQSWSLLIDGVEFHRGMALTGFRAILPTADLVNGPHTAVAYLLGASGGIERTAPTTFVTENPANHALAAVSGGIQAVPSPLGVNRLVRQTMFRHRAGGSRHLLLVYATDSAALPIQIVDLNLETGVNTLVEYASGLPGPMAFAQHPSGLVYFATTKPAHLFEYDPGLATVRNLGALHTPSDRRDSGVVAIGDDLRVYVGQLGYTNGGAVVQYDPQRQILSDLGRPDPTFSGEQQAYTVVADSRYVYVGLGQSPWYLSIIDTQNGTRLQQFREGKDTTGYVYRGKDSKIYYRRGTSAGTLWYRLEGGTALPIPSAPASGVDDPWVEHDAVVLDAAYFPTRYQVDLDLSRAHPDSAGTACVVRWRPTNSIATWNETTATGFRFTDVQIKRLYSMGANGLFVLSGNYGPIFQFEPATGSAKILGRPLLNPYDACFAGNRIYISGYTATTLSYDPSLPWSLFENTTDKFSPQTNPRVLPLQMGKYHYYAALGADGTVFAAAEHLRDSTGGELGWYDPRSGASGRMRTPFQATGPRHLLSAVGGTRILYAEDAPSVHILDATSKSIVATLAPLTDTKVDKMVDVGDGFVVGASGRKVFKLDVLGQKTVWIQDLPGDAFGGSQTLAYDRRLVFGPDKHVWLFAGNTLCRVAPGSGQVQTVLSAVPGHIAFHDTDLYIFNDSGLRRIPNLLVNLRPHSVRQARLVLSQ